MFRMRRAPPDQAARFGTRTTPSAGAACTDLPDTVSLCGAIPFSGVPQMHRSADCPTWPCILHREDCEIAIDGYFVLGDRLYLGRAPEEREAVVRALSGDLSSFLGRVQNGFFNLVVNDFRRGETRIANDACGALPLYVLYERDRLVYASTYPGLRRLAARALAIDPVGVAELYWLGYPLGNRTAFRGVELVPPGSVMTLRWSDGTRSCKRYAREARPVDLPPTSMQMAEQVVSTMRAAARRLHRPDLRLGAKLSAGMDSRLICASCPTPPPYAYTYGDPDSAEVRIARTLADALGMQHTTIPIEGDFFTTLHAPFFEPHGITEFFHQAALPAMHRDGIRFALDGLAGDVLLGGLTLRRSHARMRDALGLSARRETMPASDEAIADYILRQIRVGDGSYRPLTRSAGMQLEAAWDSVRSDMAKEVQQARQGAKSFEQLYTEVMFRNRTRRYISLQGTLCRPRVETLYPFLDRDFLSLRGRIPVEWISGKRLYVEIFSHFLPAIRSVPGLMSLLPFTASPPLHHAGRLVRYGRERAGLHLSHWTQGRINPWAANGVQWARWLAFNDAFREGARAFMSPSAAFDEAAWRQCVGPAVRNMRLTGTRFMLTASYCGYFRK